MPCMHLIGLYVTQDCLHADLTLWERIGQLNLSTLLLQLCSGKQVWCCIRIRIQICQIPP